MVEREYFTYISKGSRFRLPLCCCCFMELPMITLSHVQEADREPSPVLLGVSFRGFIHKECRIAF